MSVMSDDEALTAYRPVFLTALAMILFLVCTLGGWGIYARLDGAVVTQGVVLAESRRKTVENLEGGILSELLVAPGDRVRAGQPVAQLDTTQDRERLAQMESEHLALTLDIWRVEAEAGGFRLTRHRLLGPIRTGSPHRLRYTTRVLPFIRVRSPR